MEVFTGMNQDVPEDFFRERFALQEKPCVKIVRKTRPVPESKEEPVVQ
jgi:hypothetical protein